MREVKLNKTVAVDRLENFGFIKTADSWIYQKNIFDGQLLMTLKFTGGKIFSLVEDSTGEEYTLHLVESSVGKFVGNVRADYEKILSAFIENCCEENIFSAQLTKNLIAYVREKYGDELEFLWATFPNYAVWRRRNTQKWYAVLMEISERKLNLDSDNKVEVINLRGRELENFLDGEKFFAGYHMNKKSWYTIRLDGSVEFNEICTRLDESYKLATK